MMLKELQQAAVFLGIACIEGALLYKLIVSQNATAELLLTIGFIGVLLVVWYVADSLNEISFGKDGFKARLDLLRKEISENEEAIAENQKAIADLMLMSMGPETFINLKKLAQDGGFGPYKKKPHEGLETELYHLRNLGYIKLKKIEGVVESIRQIPEPGGNQLSDYIEVTEKGRKYIELRKNHKFPEDLPKELG